MLSITVSLFFHIFFIFLTYFFLKNIIIDDLFEVIDFEKKRVKFLKKKLEIDSKKYLEIEDTKRIEIFEVKNKIKNFFNEFFAGNFLKKDSKKFPKNDLSSNDVNHEREKNEENFYEKGSFLAKKILKKFYEGRSND